MAVARMLNSLGININLLDNRGSAALDDASVRDRLSDGSPNQLTQSSKSQAMEAVFHRLTLRKTD